MPKLSPVPKPKRPTAKGRKKQVSQEVIDLSHIAEQLRPLAVPCGDLEFDPANARKHSEKNLKAVRASLRTYGQRKPIVANRRTGTVIAGNGTLQAALALGWSHIAAVWVDDDPMTAVGFAIADNRSAELGDWDTGALDKLLREVDTANNEDLDEMLAELAQEVGMYQVEETDPPTLATDEKPPFQQLTFTLHDTQADRVGQAIQAAKRAGPFTDSLNENSNGNALTRIAEAYLGKS